MVFVSSFISTVPVQLIPWKGSSPKVTCSVLTLNFTHSLTYHTDNIHLYNNGAMSYSII